MKTNPWLGALSAVGFLALVLGLLLSFILRGTIAGIGVALLSFGALLLTGWMVASAIAWQLERSLPPRP